MNSRYTEGDVVYFAEGAEIDNTGPLAVKKGTFIGFKEIEGQVQLPYLVLWKTPDKHPDGSSMVISKEESALFSEKEVNGIVSGDVPLGTLIADEGSNRELAIVLSSEAIYRGLVNMLSETAHSEH